MTPDDDRADELWPDVPRISFGPGEPANLNACLDWVLGSREVGMQAYILGYSRAAQALFEHSTSCNRFSPNTVLFPLAFLWRHYVELALKQIIRLGQLLNQESPGTAAAHHRLLDLWKAAKPYIVEHCSAETPEMSNVQANIEEIERIDSYATGFRYLLSRDQKTMGLTDQPKLINLKVLHEAMLALSNFFDAVHTCQSIALEDPT
jgi:hypothetical protein